MGLPDMRIFKIDGKEWIAQLHDLPTAKPAEEPRAGWEVVQFDTQPSSNTQRISYRPVGWLAQASLADLIAALREGETVRARWNR
jgi:hypothetical protein